MPTFLGAVGVLQGDGEPLHRPQQGQERLTRLIERAGLPTRGPVLDAQDNAGRYLELMRVDKKAEGGEIRFVLIDGPGKAIMRAAPDALVRDETVRRVYLGEDFSL